MKEEQEQEETLQYSLSEDDQCVGSGGPVDVHPEGQRESDEIIQKDTADSHFLGQEHPLEHLADVEQELPVLSEPEEDGEENEAYDIRKPSYSYSDGCDSQRRAPRPEFQPLRKEEEPLARGYLIDDGDAWIEDCSSEGAYSKTKKAHRSLVWESASRVGVHKERLENHVLTFNKLAREHFIPADDFGLLFEAMGDNCVNAKEYMGVVSCLRDLSSGISRDRISSLKAGARANPVPNTSNERQREDSPPSVIRRMGDELYHCLSIANTIREDKKALSPSFLQYGGRETPEGVSLSPRYADAMGMAWMSKLKEGFRPFRARNRAGDPLSIFWKTMEAHLNSNVGMGPGERRRLAHLGGEELDDFFHSSPQEALPEHEKRERKRQKGSLLSLSSELVDAIALGGHPGTQASAFIDGAISQYRKTNAGLLLPPESDSKHNAYRDQGMGILMQGFASGGISSLLSGREALSRLFEKAPESTGGGTRGPGASSSLISNWKMGNAGAQLARTHFNLCADTHVFKASSVVSGAMPGQWASSTGKLHSIGAALGTRAVAYMGARRAGGREGGASSGTDHLALDFFIELSRRVTSHYPCSVPLQRVPLLDTIYNDKKMEAPKEFFSVPLNERLGQPLAFGNSPSPNGLGSNLLFASLSGALGSDEGLPINRDTLLFFTSLVGGMESMRAHSDNGKERKTKDSLSDQGGGGAARRSEGPPSLHYSNGKSCSLVGGHCLTGSSNISQWYKHCRYVIESRLRTNATENERASETICFGVLQGVLLGSRIRASDQGRGSQPSKSLSKSIQLLKGALLPYLSNMGAGKHSSSDNDIGDSVRRRRETADLVIREIFDRYDNSSHHESPYSYTTERRGGSRGVSESERHRQTELALAAYCKLSQEIPSRTANGIAMLKAMKKASSGGESPSSSVPEPGSSLDLLYLNDKFDILRLKQHLGDLEPPTTTKSTALQYHASNLFKKVPSSRSLYTQSPSLSLWTSVRAGEEPAQPYTFLLDETTGWGLLPTGRVFLALRDGIEQDGEGFFVLEPIC